MSTVTFTSTPGYGETLFEVNHYRQAVRVGDRVEISGQGGWGSEISFPVTFPESLADEIAQAFENVERTLATVGASWTDVIAVDSYHIPTAEDTIGDDHTRVMVEQFRKRMGDRAPIWTQIGVVALGAPGMRVEIRVTALVGRGA